jgi:hypothetical protein
MNRLFYYNIFFVLVIFLVLGSCKTTIDVQKNKEDPTKYIIDKNNIKEDELKKIMKSLFELIEKNIALNNFEGWYNFLTKKYKNFLNNKDELFIISRNSDYLINRKIVLENPQDYFKYVIIASREGKSLEFIDYELIDENNVKIFSLFDKKEKYVYKFKFEDNSWKLDY